MWGFGIALGFLFFVYLFVRHKSTQKQIEEDLLKTNNSNRVNTDNAEFISRMVDGALLIDKNHKIICSNNEANQFFGTEKSING